MGVPLGYYTPWELYIVAVLVAENRLKIDQPRDECVRARRPGGETEARADAGDVCTQARGDPEYIYKRHNATNAPAHKRGEILREQLKDSPPSAGLDKYSQ